MLQYRNTLFHNKNYKASTRVRVDYNYCSSRDQVFKIFNWTKLPMLGTVKLLSIEVAKNNTSKRLIH